MKTSFPPIVDKNARVLILGSMPGEESLRKQQYYAHPRNAFWYIMEKLFNIDSMVDYQKKTQILTNNYIALWDVLRLCERKGSLDSSICNDSIIANDFRTFFLEQQNINNVYFNGSKAEQEFEKRVLPTLSGIKQMKYMRLPSTSPAMARLTKEEKFTKWRIIAERMRHAG